MSGMDRLTEADREQITNAAYEAHRNWCRGARGQMISEWDSIESWVAVETAAFLAHRRASQAAPAPSDTDREWLIALLTHDQGELLDAYGVGAEVRQSDPELHGFSVAQADAILERLSPSGELAQIDAMLMDGQGDDGGDQVLPDFDPGWSVAAKVEACLHLLEKRRDVIAAPAPSDGLRVPKTLTAAQLADACMSHRHDYGLMIGDEREDVRREAAEWWRCFEKTLNDPPAHLRAALTASPAQEGGK